MLIKRKVVFPLLIISLIFFLVISALSAVALTKGEILSKLGLIERSRINSSTQAEPSEADVVVKANNFVITNTELSITGSELELSGYNPEKAKDKAVKIVIEKKALYHAATVAGYTVSDEYVQKQIDENRKAVESSYNRDDYETFLQGLGMTSEEYWDSQFETLKIYGTISNHKEALKNEYLDAGEPADGWDTYYDNYKKSVIKEEDITIIKH